MDSFRRPDGRWVYDAGPAAVAARCVGPHFPCSTNVLFSCCLRLGLGGTAGARDGTAAAADPSRADRPRAVPLPAVTFTLTSQTGTRFVVRQFPMVPAYALTIHKSQGMSLRGLVFDPHSAFGPGQVYVALSRSSTLEGLTLLGSLPPAHIRPRPEIDREMDRLRTVGTSAPDRLRL